MKKLLFSSALGCSVLSFIYLEDSYRGSLAAGGLVMLLLSMFFKTSRIQLRIAGAITLIFGVVVVISVGVHTKIQTGRVELVSPLYIHSYGYFDKVDTFQLAGAYTVFYNIYEPAFKEYYIFQRHDTFELWNRYRRVLSHRGDLKVMKQDFDHGPLNVIKTSDGRVFDLYGNEIREGYHAHTIDRTPPDDIL